jgi:hypothetical protein
MFCCTPTLLLSPTFLPSVSTVISVSCSDQSETVKMILFSISFRGFIRTLVNQEQYFSAPDSYTHEGRFAYTYTMSFKLQQDNVSSPDNSTKGDVILNGTGLNQPIVYRLPSPPRTSFTLYNVSQPIEYRLPYPPHELN